MWMNFSYFCFSSITCPCHNKDVRVVNEPVTNRCSHSSWVEHLSPFSERKVCATPVLHECSDPIYFNAHQNWPFCAHYNWPFGCTLVWELNQIFSFFCGGKIDFLWIWFFFFCPWGGQWHACGCSGRVRISLKTTSYWSTIRNSHVTD
jgi:hypothetical protein